MSGQLKHGEVRDVRPTPTVCYDCKTPVTDFVMERRQTSGGDGVVYAGDFTSVPVCANRRACIENKQQREAEKRYSRSCPICHEELAFTDSTERNVIMHHLNSHTAKDLAEAIADRKIFTGGKKVL